MVFGRYRWRFRNYRRYNRWWWPRAAWYAMTEDWRAVLVLLVVLGMVLFRACDVRAQIMDVLPFPSIDAATCINCLRNINRWTR
jgi:predicted membrane chloride channel (bestrophin family)